MNRTAGWLYAFALCWTVSLSAVPASPFPTEALRSHADWLNGRNTVPDTVGPARSELRYRESFGKGGRIGYLEETFTASNGKHARFKAEIPGDVNGGQAYGLLIYLHGDGGSDYDWFFERFRKVARKHGLIPVAIMSPTSNVNGPSWWWDADRNAVFLDELLRGEIMEKYNIDRERVIFTGASGGPTFLSGPWIRHFASQYRGGAILFCGGLVQTNLSFRDAPGFKEDFPLFYYNGTEDFLYQGAQEAVHYYRQHGLDVTAEYPPGINHCGFSSYMDRLLDERVELILKAE